MRSEKSDIGTEWFYFSQILNFENISISLVSLKIISQTVLLVRLMLYSIVLPSNN